MKGVYAFKRNLQAVGGLLALLLILSACGNNGAAPSAAGSVAPTTEAGSSAAQTPVAEETPAAEETETPAAPEMRVYTDVLGREVTIPVRPQRVVALWTVGEMLALGQKPVGAPANLLRFYSEEERAGIEVVGETVAADPEKVMALEPDLILIFERAAAEDLEKFGKIAPTVATPFFSDPYERLHIVADILGQKDKAGQWIADYNAEVAKTRELVQNLNLKGQKALVIQFALKAVYLYHTDTFPSIYDAFEFVPTDKQLELQQGDSFSTLTLSQETLSEFDADYLFVIVNDADSQPLLDEMKESAVWKGLPAVKAGHVYEIGNRLSTKDVLNMKWALGEISGKLGQ